MSIREEFEMRRAQKDKERLQRAEMKRQQNAERLKLDEERRKSREKDLLEIEKRLKATREKDDLGIETFKAQKERLRDAANLVSTVDKPSAVTSSVPESPSNIVQSSSIDSTGIAEHVLQSSFDSSTIAEYNGAEADINSNSIVSESWTDVDDRHILEKDLESTITKQQDGEERQEVYAALDQQELNAVISVDGTVESGFAADNGKDSFIPSIADVLEATSSERMSENDAAFGTTASDEESSVDQAQESLQAIKEVDALQESSDTTTESSSRPSAIKLVRKSDKIVIDESHPGNQTNNEYISDQKQATSSLVEGTDREDAVIESQSPVLNESTEQLSHDSIPLKTYEAVTEGPILQTSVEPIEFHNSDSQSVHHSESNMHVEIPLLDLSCWTGQIVCSADEKSAVAKQWDTAFSTVGFAMIIGHGIPSALVSSPSHITHIPLYIVI